MTKRRRDDWKERNWNGRIADAKKSRVERIASILQSSRAAAQIPDKILERPGIKKATSTRYTTTAIPDVWLPLSAGKSAIDALLLSVADGRDRAILGWPERPGNGFTLAALAMREARATGKLGSATFALWPWRPGLMRAARSILVHPMDIATAARNAVNDREKGEAWSQDGLAHHSLDMIELRLNDLALQNAPARVARGRRRLDILVRSPTLVETTAVFAPTENGFASDIEQILRRVCDHTHLGDAGGGLLKDRAAVGTPGTTPFALLGLPSVRTPRGFERLLHHDRITKRGIDAVVVDLTRQSKEELGEQWEKRLAILLEALDTMPGRRPPVLAVCEDPFALKAAVRTMRSHAARMKPRRQPPMEIGVYLPEPGLLGQTPALPETLPPVDFTADIKDAALVGIREKLVILGRRLRDGSDIAGARGVSQALSFLRRVGSLPLGIDEARHTADILFDADDDVDASIRAMFRSRMALAPLATISVSSPDGATAKEVVGQIEARVSAWKTETPVSAKLRELLSREGWNSPRTLIAVPDRRIAQILIASDRGVAWRCGIIDHSALAASFSRGGLDRVVVIGPSATAIRALLTSPATPANVVLLGDASGSALLAGELAPLARLPGFASIADRALAMQAALKRGGLDERLSDGESEFRIVPIFQPREIDLTQEGGVYTGEKIVLSTARHQISYRPSSDVLVFTSGEARPFERVAARDVERGDQILVLDEVTRDKIRHALATSRTSLKQLTAYHDHVARLRQSLPGSGISEKARQVLKRMQLIDPTLSDSELHNVQRWLSADLAVAASDGAKQPRAARDWPRFKLFMQANDINEILAETYWRLAIVPTRSYRVQEGYQFNQRVVQFVLDPDSFSAGDRAPSDLRGLWLSLLDAVDDVARKEIVRGGKSDE
ncbi:hypothetical protein [Rhizobium phaseoli]|uniref:hypothetical protein n=1 Tax=Rhizobium phaseoli TaxID=396 RepID=UPI001F20944B|nr:hypothetical protein [Rhizobium phaseoli]